MAVSSNKAFVGEITFEFHIGAREWAQDVLHFHLKSGFATSTSHLLNICERSLLQQHGQPRILSKMCLQSAWCGDEADESIWQKKITAHQKYVLFATGSYAPCDPRNPEKNFTSNYDGSKASEAFHVTELTEHILSFLVEDTKHIIKATSVCKHLRDTLKSSEKLRTMTFLASTPQAATLQDMPEYFQRKETMPEDINDKSHYFFNCHVNPLIFEEPTFPQSPIGSHNWTGICTFLKRDSILEQRGRGNLRLIFGVDSSTRLEMEFDRYNDDQRLLKIRKGSARDMVLAYQPRPVTMRLKFDRYDRIRGYLIRDVFEWTLAENVTAGGLVDVVNFIWRRVCDLDLASGDHIAIEDVEEKAKKYGKSVASWMKSDVFCEEHWPKEDESDDNED